ncbi:MAG: NIPSNAP family protein [Pseudomonadales bacterium]|nr:NIPSNAP family protein [Pseudomonadales bacterium]MCP5184268.1 NIPSNAP family protein [Pseudomonadales bacterium]
MFEIRNYYFRPDLFDAYVAWAKEKALAYLKRELDLVGFWVNLPEPAQIRGQAMDNLGSANITWIIRWPDMATRNAAMDTIFTTPEWQEIFKDVPGGIDSYLRMEAKFTEQIG